MTIKEWEEAVKRLNDKINSLPVWDDYAEMLQGRYDRLLKERPHGPADR